MIYYSIMSRVVSRPQSLLDGSPEIGEIVPKDSDALRDYHGNRRPVFPDGFRDVLPRGWYPQNSDQAEEMRKAGIPYVDGQFIFAISGETPGIRYGFDHPEQPENLDIAEGPIRILRLEGRKDQVTAQVLGFVGLSTSEEPVFFESNPSDRQVAGEVINDPAKQGELTQMIAAANDAIEWELH